MPKSTLSGSRIRALRTARRLTQAELARQAGVSASYLNLIEHNRRRAGPALLAALAVALQVDPESLAEDAGAALAESLRAAAASQPSDPPPETDRAEELAGRFPGWAAQLVALHGRIEAQERIIERLSDRMAHDPNLSAALHEIVSAVTAVQSTAAILAETDDLSPDWRGKFHGNIHADSVRLATAAEALVAYLDVAAEETGLAAPQEELESWLARHEFHLPAIEEAAEAGAGPGDCAGLIEGQPELASQAARALAAEWLAQALDDARALPLAQLAPALVAQFARPPGFAPDALARGFGVSLTQLFRRLSGLPVLAGVPRFGLVVCDGSGTLTFRRPIEGFALPRFGGACPLWPLYGALIQPGAARRGVIEGASRPVHRFLAHALAEPRQPLRFDMPPVWGASMLLTPAGSPALGMQGEALAQELGRALPVGSNCRICPRGECPARREPSIVAR